MKANVTSAFKLGVRVMIFWFICVGGTEAGAHDSKKRPVTVADAIEMTRWADMTYFLGGDADSRVGVFSPDGSKFVVLTRKGNLRNNTNEFSVLLFRTEHIFENPAPETLVTMASPLNRDAIRSVRWLRDNQTIVFLGSDRGEESQVYSFDVRANRLTKLTQHPTSVVEFVASGDGQRIIYEAVPPSQRILDQEKTKRNGIVITNQYPSDLFTEDCGACEKADRINRELYIAEQGKPAVRIATEDFLTEYYPMLLSPDARHVLLKVYVGEVPSGWARYQDPGLHHYLVEHRKPGIPSNVSALAILDTRTHEIRRLIDAPMSWQDNGFAWSKDGTSVAVSGTYLPLDVSDPGELVVRERTPAVVEFPLDTGKIVKITDKALAVREWDPSSGTLFLEPSKKDGQVSPEVYKKAGSVWERVDAAAPGVTPHGSLSVTIEEDLNTPPTIYVSDPQTKRKAQILDLNPQFKSLSFAKEETITWNASDGHGARGGLYLPPDYQVGKRYPLVIQTHGYDPDRFWIDGPWDSAFAAQALANSGIVVVQADEVLSREEYKKFWVTPEEGPHEMTMFEGLIDELDKRGLIDRNKVGLIGFSRTAYHTAYTLTHSKYHFKAATLADGFEGGYVNFVLFPVPDYNAVNGGAPFGPSFSAWIRNSPGFNLDKVEAAVRIEEYSPGHFIGGWEWFSGLSSLHKPVDFIWIPNGTHLLVKPWERLTSEQGNVDWFRFWLKGEEDPDPAKAEQYERWRELRRLQGKSD